MAFLQSEGYSVNPALLFSNVQSIISTDAPPSMETGASVELPNVESVNRPVALSVN